MQNLGYNRHVNTEYIKYIYIKPKKTIVRKFSGSKQIDLI